MKRIHFERKNLTKVYFEDVQFLMFAEGGAMGEAGAIKFIKADGNLYEFNYVYEKYDMEDFIKAFPVFDECAFGPLGMDCEVPEGWRYVDLGLGNHLLVRAELYPQYRKKIQKYQSKGQIYQNWIRHADEVMKERGEKKVKNNVTELVFILDKSGSMAGLEKDTIGGFNSMIEKQRKTDGECYVSTVLFNGTSEVIHDRVKLSKIKPMTEKDYFAYGSTALLDAVGGAIRHIGNVHKYARPEDVPAHTLFVITTDGMENASQRYTGERVKYMIERQKIRYGWEFLFIGANIDAVKTAARYGIAEDRAVNYVADEKGTRTVFEGVAEAVRTVRDCGGISPVWNEEIAKDHEKRGRKA